MYTVAVIIPALNEAGNIRPLVEETLALSLKNLQLSVIVVDNDSTDDTADRARAGGATVVSEPRRGYGYACTAGIAAANADIIAFLDGDYSSPPVELPRLLAPLLNGQADLCQGSRELGGIAPGAMPLHQRWGNRLAVGLINRLYGLQLTDLGPARAIQRDWLERLNMREMTYGWTAEMTVKAARLGARIVEAPVSWQRRRAGKSKVSGTLGGALLAGWFIVGVTFRYSWPPGK